MSSEAGKSKAIGVSASTPAAGELAIFAELLYATFMASHSAMTATMSF